MTGKSLRPRMALFRPASRSAASRLPSSKNFSSRCSSASATASTRRMRASAASVARSAGIASSLALPLPSRSNRIGLLPDEVDHSGEVLLGPDRQLHRQHLSPEGLLQTLEAATEVRPFAVHLVAVQDDRQSEIVSGLPDLFGVDLGTGDGADTEQGGVGDAQRGARLGEKDAVAGGVEQIDLVLFPRQVADAEADGDAAFPLFGVEVGDRVAVFDLQESRDRAGSEQKGAGQSGLPGVVVTGDRDVPDPAWTVDLHRAKSPFESLRTASAPYQSGR